MRMSCPHCQGAIEIGPELAGRQVRCPLCSQIFTAPAEETAAPQPEVVATIPAPSLSAPPQPVAFSTAAAPAIGPQAPVLPGEGMMFPGFGNPAPTPSGPAFDMPDFSAGSFASSAAPVSTPSTFPPFQPQESSTSPAFNPGAATSSVSQTRARTGSGRSRGRSSGGSAVAGLNLLSAIPDDVMQVVLLAAGAVGVSLALLMGMYGLSMSFAAGVTNFGVALALALLLYAAGHIWKLVSALQARVMALEESLKAPASSSPVQTASTSAPAEAASPNGAQ